MEITIPGKPIAKKRPRFYRKGKFVGTYNAQQTEEGRWLLEAQKQVDKKIVGKPIHVEMFFVMPIPKGTSKKKHKGMIGKPHIKKPDIDNLIKFALDCMNGLCWHDDSMVALLCATKIYGHTPQTYIQYWVI